MFLKQDVRCRWTTIRINQRRATAKSAKRSGTKTPSTHPLLGVEYTVTKGDTMGIGPQKEEAVVSTRQCEQHVDCERECKNVPEEKDADESLGDVDMYNYNFSDFITIL